MSDVFSKRKRSAIMRAVRSSANESTEKRLIAIFRASKITGWRRKYPLHGNPDFVFPQKRIVIFVDGCFWHGCPEHYRRPSSRREYWDAKILRNQRRDRAVTRMLRASGWRVIRLWEHSLTHRVEPKTIARLKKLL
ncbi:MAG: very short patch repair endonuclease [Opitutaceae bacterium]|jgi:DNA mismatch endonuclease (patch repair protein)|nr:very short patch repair endonuclease [Opitutaceae bacterium]